MGTLYLVSTPIGNLEDITLRAIKTLFSVDFIACEDTRKTGNLIQNYELRIKNQELKIPDLNTPKIPKYISYYDEIELKRIPEIINLLQEGKDIALVSDSGTPLICDPGYKLVKECLKQNIKITSIPGPSSVITALTLSGLPPNDFRFIGYLPSNQTKRQKLLNNLLANRKDGQSSTIIAFETPHRLSESLADIKNIFGDIEMVICRELTKIYEEVWR
ncbi:16S rRNA (cytidine(1402)-2'-O)-methyltransferase [Candidatus Microgenomates bacterium]|nr:16S rRNA (cytidine(1402)-2'-O)-methyltransferase [Candidatus Microgenomates bacterium]